MIYILAGAAIANWHLRDAMPPGKQNTFPRGGNRSV
jgi:hypothetical protein